MRNSLDIKRLLRPLRSSQWHKV